MYKLFELTTNFRSASTIRLEAIVKRVLTDSTAIPRLKIKILANFVNVHCLCPQIISVLLVFLVEQVIFAQIVQLVTKAHFVNGNFNIFNF